MDNEIRRTQWAGYFREFSKRNYLRPTKLEIFSDLGAQREAEHLPLMGIAVEEVNHTARIEIMLGSGTVADARHLTHTIDQVSRIFSKLSADGREEVVSFEDAEGNKTLLSFEALVELTASH